MGRAITGSLPKRLKQKMLTTLKRTALFFLYIYIFLNPKIKEVLGDAPFQRTGYAGEVRVAKL